MRISDWSSDVCSSDLLENRASAEEALRGELAALQVDLVAQERALAQAGEDERTALRSLDSAEAARERHAIRLSELEKTDRTSAEKGKRESVQLEQGGRRKQKKKNRSRVYALKH